MYKPWSGNAKARTQRKKATRHYGQYAIASLSERDIGKAAGSKARVGEGNY